MDVMSVYNKLPIFAQNIACAYEGSRLARLRYGGSFETKFAEYKVQSKLSGDEIASIRNAKLRVMASFCYEHVPYYKRLFDECGIDARSINDERDIASLPILTKDVVRTNLSSFQPDNIQSLKPYITEHTSGSTGSSLIFNQSVENVRELWAVFWRFWNRLGIERDTLCADFGSRTIVPSTQSAPPFWRNCPPLRQIKFSAFHANEMNYHAYAKEFDRAQLQWIHGYPSCIVPFASFILENGIEFKNPVKWITTSGENLYDHQRAQIKKAFGVEPYSLYSLTEATACISENYEHKLVVDEDYSLVEFVKSEAGWRIVGSNLSNFAFPLLRYDTGDICSLSDDKLNGWRQVDYIDGRNAELIRLPDGGTVGALSALFTESSSVKEAQIVQSADYSVTISFVPVNEHYKQDIEQARRKFIERTRGMLSVDFVRVDHIPRTSRGKLRYVVSEIQ